MIRQLLVPKLTNKSTVLYNGLGTHIVELSPDQIVIYLKVRDCIRLVDANHMLMESDIVYRLDPLHLLHRIHQIIYLDALPTNLSHQSYEIRRQCGIHDRHPVGCMWHCRRLLHLHSNRETLAPHARRRLHESFKVLLRSSDSQHRH